MTRAVPTLTAATAGLGLAALASTSAKAFVIAPLAVAAIIGGSVLGGAMLGSAATNSPVVVTPGAAVSVNSTTCYFTNRLVNPVTQTWTLERVCTTTMP